MLKSSQSNLLPALTAWLQAEPSVSAAVVFGSQVRKLGEPGAADDWSDVDLHLVTTASANIEQTNWAAALPSQHFCRQVVRPATGGVRKITALFSEGEADMVILPARRLRLASLAMSLGLHRKNGSLRYALNSLSTIMRGGYRFLKGERKWGAFYAKVVADMPGYRISDDEVNNLVEIFLCDLLWVLQKLERGELVAAQRILHRSLIEINILLLHEARIRQSRPTFQQARRVEQLTSPAELRAVQLSSRLDHNDLRLAAWQTFDGMKFLMAELQPAWSVPAAMDKLLARYSLLSR